MAWTIKTQYQGDQVFSRFLCVSGIGGERPINPFKCGIQAITAKKNLVTRNQSKRLRILIDDFDAATRREAVRIARSAPYDGRIPLEVSGGVDLTTLRAIAEDGVDCISIGGLTKHVHAIDFSLKLGPPPTA